MVIQAFKYMCTFSTFLNHSKGGDLVFFKPNKEDGLLGKGIA